MEANNRGQDDEPTVGAPVAAIQTCIQQGLDLIEGLSGVSHYTLERVEAPLHEQRLLFLIHQRPAAQHIAVRHGASAPNFPQRIALRCEESPDGHTRAAGCWGLLQSPLPSAKTGELFYPREVPLGTFGALIDFIFLHLCTGISAVRSLEYMRALCLSLADSGLFSHEFVARHFDLHMKQLNKPKASIAHSNHHVSRTDALVVRAIKQASSRIQRTAIIPYQPPSESDYNADEDDDARTFLAFNVRNTHNLRQAYLVIMPDLSLHVYCPTASTSPHVSDETGGEPKFTIDTSSDDEEGEAPHLPSRPRTGTTAAGFSGAAGASPLPSSVGVHLLHVFPAPPPPPLAKTSSRFSASSYSPTIDEGENRIRWTRLSSDPPGWGSVQGEAETTCYDPDEIWTYHDHVFQESAHPNAASTQSHPTTETLMRIVVQHLFPSRL